MHCKLVPWTALGDVPLKGVWLIYVNCLLIAGFIGSVADISKLSPYWPLLAELLYVNCIGRQRMFQARRLILY